MADRVDLNDPYFLSLSESVTRKVGNPRGLGEGLPGWVSQHMAPPAEFHATMAKHGWTPQSTSGSTPGETTYSHKDFPKHSLKHTFKDGKHEFSFGRSDGTGATQSGPASHIGKFLSYVHSGTFESKLKEWGSSDDEDFMRSYGIDPSHVKEPSNLSGVHMIGNTLGLSQFHSTLAQSGWKKTGGAEGEAHYSHSDYPDHRLVHRVVGDGAYHTWEMHGPTGLRGSGPISSVGKYLSGFHRKA